jgi:hypothetical protein
MTQSARILRRDCEVPRTTLPIRAIRAIAVQDFLSLKNLNAMPSQLSDNFTAT